MAEKELMTRIQLKYDSYENWSNEQAGDGKGAKFVLKAGEVGICTIPAGVNAEGVQNPPHVMMKVGDGSTVFSALPWMSAKAADVFAWAKQENLFIEREGTGNVISGIEWDASLNDGKGGVKYTTAAVATAQGLEDLQKEVYGENGSAADSRIDKLEKDIADNRAAWAKDDNTTYTFVKSEKGITITPSEGEAQTITFEYLTQAEIETLLANYYTKGEIDTKFEGYYTKGEVDGLIPTDLGVMSISGKDAIAVTEGATPEVSLKLDNSGNVTLSQGANGLKAEVTIPAQAEYSIVKDATSDYAATYHLTKDGVNVGAAINIPKDMVVESGEVKELEAGVWGDAGTYIVITLANATDDKLYISVGDLIEYVTSGSAEGDMVVVAIDEAHKVTATITDGTITEAKLHADVTTKLNKVWEEVGVAQGLVDGLANGQVKTNKEAIENITKEDGLIAQALAAAKEDSSSKDAVVLAEAQKASSAVQANLDAHTGNGDIHVTADQKSVWNSAVQTVNAEGGLKATRVEGSNDVTIAIDETVTFVFNCGGADVPEA